MTADTSSISRLIGPWIDSNWNTGLIERDGGIEGGPNVTGEPQGHGDCGFSPFLGFQDTAVP